jgi:hypothetical protein
MEEHRFRVLRISVHDREKVTGIWKNYIMRRFGVFTAVKLKGFRFRYVEIS